MQNSTLKPSVLCLSGLDPSGGAGIQADIESLLLSGCHCLPLITLNSVQDSQGVYQITATGTEFLLQQFEKINQDLSISAVKIGMLANTEQVSLVKKIINQLDNIPIVLDPVLGSGLNTGLGTKIAKDEQVQAIYQELLPHCTLVTPNTLEAHQLHQVTQTKSFSNSLDNQSLNKYSLNKEQLLNHASDLNKFNSELNVDRDGQSILQSGVQHVLITGTHEHPQGNINIDTTTNTSASHTIASNNSTNKTTNTIEHRLYSLTKLKSFVIKRLPNSYHGSGCTLASAIAGNLAQQQSIESAIEKALEFTEQSLINAQALGKHQLFPNRYSVNKP